VPEQGNTTQEPILRPVLADSDFLIQVLWAKQRRLLGRLSSERTIVVVEEVESEVRWHRKFKGQFEPEFLRAVSAGEVTVLDRSLFRRLVGPNSDPTVAELRFDEYQKSGQRYCTHVGDGEAYTHAAAVRLLAPVFSHDHNAVRLLLGCGLPVGGPVLSFYDLLKFAVDEQWLPSEKAAEVVKFLRNQGEWVPTAIPKGKCQNIFGEFETRIRRCGKENAALWNDPPEFLEL
jgi:hypothetical protein